MRTAGPDTWAEWHHNSTGDFGPVYITDNGSSVAARDDFQGAFRVTGDQIASVPEPSPLALTGMIGALLLVARAVKAWAGDR